MARPKNLKKIVAALTDEEKAAMRELLKEDPEVTQLKAKRAKLLEELSAVDARLAELTGGKRRGRKAGRKATVKAVPAGTAPKRRGRKPKAVAASTPAAAPKRRGRKPKSVAPAMTPAKADTVSGDASPATASAPKIRRPRLPKRVIVDNDLIPPKS